LQLEMASHDCLLLEKEAVARIVEDLIRIAKVAMPPKLFDEDPRVKKAQALLVSLGRPSPPGRAPNTGPDELEAILGAIVDIRPVDASTIVLDWDLVEGILRARDHGLPTDDSAPLNTIVRDWLIGHGYLDPPPDDLN
jgi:hypothetical protein